MKVLVTGSRDWYAEWVIRMRLNEAQPDTIVEGGQTGADKIARGIASELGADVVTYWANWKRYGKAAGPRRNAKMLAEQRPDLVLAFPMPASKGTWDMVKQATVLGIPVRAFDQKNEPVAQPKSVAAVDSAVTNSREMSTRVNEKD